MAAAAAAAGRGSLTNRDFVACAQSLTIDSRTGHTVCCADNRAVGGIGHCNIVSHNHDFQIASCALQGDLCALLGHNDHAVIIAGDGDIAGHYQNNPIALGLNGAVLSDISTNDIVQQLHDAGTVDVCQRRQAVVGDAADVASVQQCVDIAARPGGDIVQIIEVFGGRGVCLDAQRTGQHDKHLLAVEQLIGLHGGLGRAVQDACSNTLGHGVGIPCIRRNIAEVRDISARRDLHQVCKQHSGLCAGHRPVGVEVAVAVAVYDAGVCPTVNGAFCPVTVCIIVVCSQSAHRAQRRCNCAGQDQTTNPFFVHFHNYSPPLLKRLIAVRLTTSDWIR